MGASVVEDRKAATTPPIARPYILGALAALSVGAAAIHFAVIFEHFDEYVLYGVFFLVIAWAQLIWAALVLWRPSRAVLWLGILGNAIIIAVYVASRTVGLPVGPDINNPEAVGGLDVVSVVLEVALIAGCAALLWRPALADRPVRRRGTAGTIASLVAVPAAVIAVTTATRTSTRWSCTSAPRSSPAGRTPAPGPRPDLAPRRCRRPAPPRCRHLADRPPAPRPPARRPRTPCPAREAFPRTRRWARPPARRAFPRKRLAAHPRARPPARRSARLGGHPAHPRRCHLDDGPALAPAAARALACHATVTWVLHDHDGTLLDVGRRHRRATAALRRAVRERDRGRCQFPGCRSRRTDLHHIIAWAQGGTTRLRDLILLCEAHHVIVHALGYLITPTQDGGFTFTRPDGHRMPHGPVLPGSDGDLGRCHDADITTETIIPAGLGDKLDLDLAIWACLANARLDQQRASQQHEQDLAA